MPILKVGERWGHLTVEDRGADPVIEIDQHQRRYETGETEPAWVALRCECGRRFRIFEHEFPGKRKLRSCGHRECRLTPETEHHPVGRPKIAERGKSTVVYLMPSFTASVNEYAKKRGMSFSGAFRMIAELGLKHLRETERNGDITR